VAGYNRRMDALTETLRQRVYALWDALAERAPTAEGALDALLAALCELVAADDAHWLAAVRLPDMVAGDPVHGWRPRFFHYLRPPSPVLTQRVAEQVTQLEAGVVDITTVRNVALAGAFRANRLVDLAGEAWFADDYYRRYYLEQGRADAIWCGCPVSADAEVYIGLFRSAAQPRFTPAERDTVAFVLRGLRWFHRQSLLGRGLLAASAPLTGVERKVLQGLLGGRQEKEIAADLGQSPHTTHSHVRGIYRKFGVNNRAALMALWLGKGGAG